MDAQGRVIERRRGYTLVLDEDAVVSVMCALKRGMEESQGRKGPSPEAKPKVVN